MKKSSYIVLLFFLLSNNVFAQNAATKIAPKDLIEDFEILEKHLKTVHAGLYNYHTPAEFTQIFNAYKNELNEAHTPLEFYQKIGPLLKDIGDAHTDIEPPESFYDGLNNECPVFPISVYWVKEKLYVFDDFSNEQSTQLGDQIISINSLSANEVFKNIRQYVPRDGFNLTSPNHTLSGIFGQFRNFYASIYGHPEKFQLVIKGANGKEKNIEVAGLKYKTIFKKYDQQKRSKPKKNPLQFDIKKDVAILTVQSFHPGQIKEARQKYKRFFKQSFKQINQTNPKKLIIDIRGNGGGHESVFIELFSYLTDKEFTAYRQLHTITNEIPDAEFYRNQRGIAQMEKWAKKKLIKQGNLFLNTHEIGTKSIQPKKNPYLGKLYILVDGKSSSAAGDFSGLVKGQDRATFIGEEAGGNPYVNTAGMRFTLVLPHSGIQVYIPSLFYTINNKGMNNGHGLQPDHPIELTIEDVIKKKDKAMEFALSLE